MVKGVKTMIIKITTIICLLILTFFLVEMPTSVLSEEIKYPIACYEGKELEKVRRWEKIWVGKRIDSTSLDEVKELIPESLYNIMKNSQAWGESWFEIVPYREYNMTAGRIEATKKYSPKCRIGEKDELIDWIAGVPFPQTKRGIELAWNFYANTRGDTQFSEASAFIVDGRKEYDRNIAFKTWVTFFAGRYDVPPTPEILPNKQHIYRGAFAEFLRPSEMKGFLNFQITYKETLKPYDSWAWIAAIRRVRRISTAQRIDTVGGQDSCYDDNYGWDGAITRNSYKLLGRKEILSPRHQDVHLIEHTEGDCIFDGLRKERINTWVVEAINKDPGYIYSKSIWYIDPESWEINHADRYDKYGKLWKIFENFGAVAKGYKGQEVPFFCGTHTIDVQRRHATLGANDTQVGIEIPLDMFTINYLKKYGR